MMTSKFLSVCGFTTFLNFAGMMGWQYSQFFGSVTDDTRREMVTFHFWGLFASVIGCVIMAGIRHLALEDARKRGGYR